MSGNPFHTQPGDVGNPYSNPGYYGPPPKESGPLAGFGWLIIAVVVGGLVMGCCGCGGLVYFGMTIETGQLQASLDGNPVVEEHIGEITKFQINFSKSVDEAEDVWVYRVEGTKGKGYIVGETHEAPDGSSSFLSGELRLDDGRTVPLFPHDEAAEPEMPH